MNLLAKRVHARLPFTNDPQIIKANRLSGKTQLVCGLAAKLAPTHRVCIVSSCRRAGRECLITVASMLPGSQIVGDRVMFGNGWVQCGTTFVDADSIFVDDAQYMRPELYEALTRSGTKRVLLIGTPTGNPNNVLARLGRIFNVIDATQRSSAL